jgi:hypothetical protein
MPLVPVFIPEGEPQFNGSVENFNGWFQEPLFQRRFRRPSDLRRELARLQEAVTPRPTSATTPENSCPRISGSGRTSPDRVLQVGAHWNSVGVTAAAWTRTRTSASPALGRGASSVFV